MTPNLARAAAGATLALLAAGCTAPGGPTPTLDAARVGEVRAGSGVLNGYLDRKSLPDSLALLPAPPAAGSARAAADLEAYRATRALRDSPRWRMAIRDNELQFPAAATTFACALGVPISQDATPHTYMLLRRTLADAGLSTYGAKDHYKRQRPFAALKESSCVPGEEKKLANDGSYPSGHAALGWAWGLVLSSIAPERTDALVQRGNAYGQSRMICGVHWQSDVDAGQLMGAAAFARLQSDPVFTAQLAEARREVAAARAKGLRPDGDCAAEAAALAR